MDHRSEGSVGFFISCGNSSEGFELTEEILDQMTPPVHMEVAGNRAYPVRLGRDHGYGTAIVQLGTDGVAIEGFVGEERFEFDVLDERLDADAVMALARQQDEAREIAERVDQRHDLGRQAAAR